MNFALLLLINLAGHNPAPLPPPAKMEATGKVREVLSGEGIKPQAVLQLDDNSELILHGRTDDDEVELLRLNGVRVHVSAVKGDPLLPRGNHIRVEDFRILDVGGGVVPRMGRIASIEVDGKQRLLFVDDDGKADFLPNGYLAKMNKHIGARVWMVGTKDKADLVPTRFSILRGKGAATKVTGETP